MRMRIDGKWEFSMGKNYYVLKHSENSFAPVLEEAEKINTTLAVEENLHQIVFGDTILLPSTTEISKKGTLLMEEEQKAYLSRVYPFTGKCYYKRKVTLPMEFIGKGLKLVLERTKFTKVYFDGELVSESFDTLIAQEHILSRKIDEPEHEILIVVDNHLLSYDCFPKCFYNGHQFTHHTQTNWNGIIGEIYLERIGNSYFKTVTFEKEKNMQSILFQAEIEHHGDKEQVQLDILLSESGEKYTFFEMLKNGENHVTHSLAMPKKLPEWDEFQRNLFEVQLLLQKAEECLDAKTERIGLRNVEVKEKSIYVSGKKIFLRGNVDCAIYPLTGCPPMTKEGWMQILQEMKEYGLNHYRFHSWCPPKQAFAAADELGIYLEVELPIFGTGLYDRENELWDETLEKAIYEQAKKVITTYGNHPSFLLFAVGNEMFGDFSAFEKVLAYCKGLRRDILYSQGANNFFETPKTCKEDEYWVTMRTSYRADNVRASFSHSDLPLGYLQTEERQGTTETYEKALKKSNVPLISHETGQYQVYPNLEERHKYVGVTKSTALELAKKRLAEKGLLSKAKEFFICSGALAVQCYKEEIESSLRTEGMSGFQLLSLQDFPGQGTALIGILDSFLDSKGLISKEAFREFCNSRVIFAKLPFYTYTAGESIPIEVGIYNYGEGDMKPQTLSVRLLCEKGIIDESILENVAALQGQNTTIKAVELSTASCDVAVACTLELSYGELRNHYPIWIYPAQVSSKVPEVNVIFELGEAEVKSLGNKETVVLFSDKLPNSMEAGFTSDFWAYEMFHQACLDKKLKPAPGTMGLVIEKEHEALKDFPTERYASWQWQQIVTKAKPVILDKETEEYQMIVEVIDNFERGHKLGLLYEKKIGSGTLLICTVDLPNYLHIPECRQLYHSILCYAEKISKE